MNGQAEIRARASVEEKEVLESIAQEQETSLSELVREAPKVYFLDVVPMVYRVILLGTDAHEEIENFRLRHPELRLSLQMASLSRHSTKSRGSDSIPNPASTAKGGRR